MNDIKIISEIEYILGRKIKLAKRVANKGVGYFLDSNSRVNQLWLQNCNIEELNTIIDLIRQIPQLSILSLSHNQIRDFSVLCDLPNLKELHLQANKTVDVNTLKNLNQLTSLNLRAVGLTDISFLESLTSLEELYLSSNNITNLEPLRNTTKLKNLDFTGNNIEDLSALENLKDLLVLTMVGCKISDIEPLSKLKKLIYINASNNKIRSINPLKSCKNLSLLWLYNNEVSDLRPLEFLIKLKELGLGRNPVSYLEPLVNLKRLEELQLIENNIKDVSILTNLISLKKLYLSDNQVSNIEPLKNLSKLKELDLRRNPIEELPSWIVDLKLEFVWEQYRIRNKSIHLHDNPLKSPPPEIVKQGLDAVVNYFGQLKEGNVDYLFEAKLLIIGEPGAGKTTMAWKLEDATCALPKEDDTTRGIDIKPYYFPIRKDDLESIKRKSQGGDESFRLNLWDFGGQEIYKATHRFFLSTRALYALVADSRNEDTDFNYWLHVVEMFGGESPLIIVLNEKHNRKRNLDISAMRSRFSNIKDVISINFANGQQHLNDLKRSIEYNVTKLPHFGSPVPAKWTVVRDLIDSDNRNTISLQDYYRICSDNGIDKKRDAELISQYFHDIGVFLHFQDDDLLRNTIFLKPNWATNAVYKLLDHNILNQKNGKFNRSDVREIWHEDEFIDFRSEFLRLMQRFYLAYQVENSDEFIVPERLTATRPEYEWEQDRNLQLRYEYEVFMPKGIVTQLIVQMHGYIKNHNHVWRRGVLLERDHAIAEVTESYDSRIIGIRISGKNKRDFMTIITEQLDKINVQQYKNLQFTKYIPCICSECKRYSNPHFYKEKVLRHRLDNGRIEVECEKSFEKVNILNLIDEVLNKDLQMKEIKINSTNKPSSSFVEKPVRDSIFISYSHNDSDVLARVQSHLKVLETEGVNLNLWDDTKIKPGMKWRKEIETGLQTAKVGILLISTDFLASDFIRKQELPALLKAAEDDGAAILPLIVKPCRFTNNKSLSIFQAVNDPQKPFSSLSLNDQEELLVKMTDRVEEIFGSD